MQPIDQHNDAGQTGEQKLARPLANLGADSASSPGGVPGVFATPEAEPSVTGRDETLDTGNLLALAVEQSAEMILILDRSGIVTYVNPAFTRTANFSRNSVIGRDIARLCATREPESHADLWKIIWEQLHRGQPWKGRMINCRADGTEYRVEATFSPVRDNSGEVMRYIVVQHDITQIDELESQLRQMQKMEAVGRLAGGVAHDFNNLLTVILGYTDLLLHRFADDSSVSGELQEIRKASERGSNLTRQLLTFSRNRLVEPQPIDLNETVRDMEKMLRRVIGEDIQLSARLGEAVGKIQIDPGQVSQLILNLAINARDAMPQGGRLIITTTQMRLDGDTAARTVSHLQPGDYVLLTFTDTGTGMSPEVQSKIFEPFFTTKEHRGTGLGLSTVYGIVRQAGGDIRVMSREAEGTTFQLLFPRLLEEDIEALDFAPAPLKPRGGHETILLVEDEELVRTLIAEMLRKNGYRVLQAMNGRKALEIFREKGSEIDLLITDIVMPEMGGRDVVTHIRSESPMMRVLYMSGYTHEAINNFENFGPDISFIEKPFKSEEFLGKVRGMLEQHSVRTEIERKHSA